MLYKSTRGNKMVKSSYALLHGLAEDGGLYIPADFPTPFISYDAIKDKNYMEIAELILAKFFPDFAEADLREMINSAYNLDNFDTLDIAPLHSLTENTSILELWHGRTQAFKDMALSIFPYLLVAAKKEEKEDKDILILTATSGDTGKAALEGFADVNGTYIQVFYPTDGVSPIQKAQMQRQQGDNVRVTAIKGNFDDAQQFLKKLFVDENTVNNVIDKGIVFSSANSINVGRLIPQIVYYVNAYKELLENGIISGTDKFNIVVPTGNFGNILAAYYAKMLGVPIHKLICASNKNKVLADFITTGTYDMNRDFYVTLSPSMDILQSSNFERFLYYMFDENTDKTNEFINSLKEKGIASVSPEIQAKIRKEFYGAWVSDEETLEIIRETYNVDGYLLDPHTAVALGAYEAFIKDNPAEEATHTIIASTAHPFKFPEAIAKALNLKCSNNPFETINDISTVTGVGIPREFFELSKLKNRFEHVIQKENLRDSVLEFVDDIVK